MAAYEAARAASMPQRAPRASAGTLAWLIGRYQDSGAWARLSVASHRQRENIFKNAIKASGADPITKISKAAIIAALDRHRATPFAALDFLKAMRGLFRWATESGFISKDPTEGVRWQVPRTEGFHVWTEEEIAKFEAHWPIGTRERLAMAVLLYTGLRRGDAARLGRQHVREEVFEIDRGKVKIKVKITVIRIRTEKTGILAVIPVLPELAEAIAATKTGDLAFMATAHGAPMVKEGFGNWFRGACRAAGVPGSAHGLRKAGATRAANNGATEAELRAIYAWGPRSREPAHYTEQADRVKLAREAMGKLSGGLGVWGNPGKDTVTK